jgi:succinate-acetate transporter protein
LRDSGIFFFVGPVLLIFAMVFEWIMGNFFPMMVMGLFGVFWLSFGVLQLPTLQLGAPYATIDDPSGMGSREFNAALGLYLLVWGFALFTFFIFTLKINTVFALIFGLVSIACWVLSGAYFKASGGDFEAAGRLQKVSFPHKCTSGNRSGRRQGSCVGVYKDAYADFSPLSSLHRAVGLCFSL